MAASYVVKYALAFYLEKENDKLNKDKNIMAFENQGSCSYTDRFQRYKK